MMGHGLWKLGDRKDGFGIQIQKVGANTDLQGSNTWT